MADYYNSLVPARRYLKNIEKLEGDPTRGITRADLLSAQAAAKAEVDSALAGYYEVSDWASSTPPVIEDLAELLSSAHVLRYRYEREAPASSMVSNFPELLRRQALAMLEDIRKGRRLVILADGSIQSTKQGLGLAVPRVQNPEEE